MKHFVLLCDYGLDDAAATAELFLRKQREDRVDVLPVGGNMPLKQTERNARILLSHLCFEPSTVRLVDTSPIPQPEERLPSIHGEDGMGDFLRREKPLSVEELSLAEWEKGLTGEEILVSLGPCTVTKYLLERHSFAEFWMMAGNVSCEPNFRGREFNHALDVEAFAFCTGYPHKAATLDSCRHEKLNLVKHPPKTEDPLLKELFERSLRYATARHNDRCFAYDWVLVRAMFFPESFACDKRQDPDGNWVNVLRYLG